MTRSGTTSVSPVDSKKLRQLSWSGSSTSAAATSGPVSTTIGLR
jgi:hypothetical protein